MRVRDLAKILELKLVAGDGGLDRPVNGGYCGDLLSDVMANAPEGAVWLTVQTHQNIVAVAVLRELASIILVNGCGPDAQTIEKGNQEGIPIFLSDQSAYEIAGILYDAGIGKTGDEGV